MSDDLDPSLVTRFAAARETPLDAQFLVACLARLERERRRSARQLAATCGVGLLLLVWKLPALLSFSGRLADHMVAMLIVPAVQAVWAPAGLSAAGWGASLLTAAWVLWQLPARRRRR